jgi:uncharacterized membrane protein YeaQ/YmgE (transglycosylase-associated protein family)
MCRFGFFRKQTAVENPQFMQVAEQWANTVLVWVGFGTLAGLLAKAIMPGKDPGGALATVIMGILGCVLGAGVLAFMSDHLHFTPLSPIGFVVATAGAFALLTLYRLMHARNFNWALGRTGRAPRRRVSVVEEE